MDTEKILKHAEALRDEVIGFRRRIHRNPELSFRETGTAKFIADTLEAAGIECVGVAGTGVLARIAGCGDPASAVVLRADIDALPVHEATGLPFASCNPGVMHACGHDMHTAALMGAMLMLNKRRDQISGTVFGLFQPGEELLPGGASKVLAEDPFSGYDIRAFFGQHAEPELPTGFFGLRAGEYMASTDELYFTVRGVGGHGALRHNLKDPVQAAAVLITELLDMGNTGNGHPDSVLSIGSVSAAGATNIVPDRVEMAGTLRTFDEGLRNRLKTHIREICLSLSATYGVAIDPDIRDGFPSVVNAAELTAKARCLLIEAFGAGSVIALERRMTGEDFGYYTRRYPSLFYRFGVGGRSNTDDRSDAGAGSEGRRYDVGKLHSPVFNPDEDALTYAAAGLTILALNN